MPWPVTLIVCVLTQLFAVSSGTTGHAAQASGIVSGRVEIETSRTGPRAPVRRAKVVLTREGSRDIATTSTDSEARFRFEGLVPGRYVMSVEKPGFVSNTSAPFELADTTRTVDVGLIPGGALEGRLQNDRNGAIAQLAVTADRLNEQGTVSASYVATTDDLGRFRIHSLPAGRYRVRAKPWPPASGQEHFLPGTTTASTARVIEITAGITIDGLQFIVPVAPLSPAAAAAIEGSPPAAEQPLNPRTARVTGTITRSDSAQPIANAIVQLTDGSGVFRYRATSGLDGQFEVANVPAGTWTLLVMAAGFVSTDAFVTRPGGAGIRLTLKEGERRRQDVTLAAMSAVEGFIVDEFGDPAPGVAVQVAQKGAALGLSRFLTSLPSPATAITDDRGWFRIPALYPGDQYLIAVPPPFERSWMTGFAPTFFPGTTAADAATPITIAAGRDVYNVRFAIGRARTGTVTGQIVDAAGRPVPGQVAGATEPRPNSRVVLLPVEDGEVRAMVMATVMPEADGSFRVNDMPEGSYVVQSMGPNMFGVSSVTVDATNPERARVRIIMKPLTTARGRVLFEGDAPTAPPVAPGYEAIGFQPMSFTTGPVGSNRIVSVLHSDWRFELPNLAWFGVLRVNPPSGWALVRVRHEGRDITDTPFDFQSADVSGLEVVLTDRVGSVSGTVTSGGQPAAKAGVLVMGVDDATWAYLSRTMRSVTTDERGTFTMAALLPGRYVAVPASGDMRLADHASLLALRSLGVPFTVSERANSVVTLTLQR